MCLSMLLYGMIVYYTLLQNLAAVQWKEKTWSFLALMVVSKLSAIICIWLGCGGMDVTARCCLCTKKFLFFFLFRNWIFHCKSLTDICTLNNVVRSAQVWWNITCTWTNLPTATLSSQLSSLSVLAHFGKQKKNKIK